MKIYNFLFLLTPFFIFSSCKNNSESVPDGFQIMDGYSLSLVASEPMIADPVDLEFDENGDAFVLEMPGYPYEDRQSRIVKLLDSDGDGTFDDHQVFAESLQLASSILPYKKGMLVAGPPYLLYVADQDGDGVAEYRDTLMGGFSTGNLQHNYNGLTYGLDNWIYAANGGNSGAPFWWGDSTSQLDLRGDDIRIDLENKIIERIGYSSGGYELAVDNYGRIFETHNLEHISQSVFSGRYINDIHLPINHTLVNVSDHEEGGLARIYPIGEQESRVNHPEQSGYFSGACGITHYGGGSFEDLNNSIWIADVVLNLIHVDKMSELGASFSASRVGHKKDFLASTDRAFRPVNMTVGPDGSMYVVDMYRKVIEHPEWIPDEIEKTLDLDAGKDKGRIYRITSDQHSSVSFDFSSTDNLIMALENPNQWVRNTAHRLLMEQPLDDIKTSKLKEALSSKNEYSRLHSMWILHVQGEISVQEVMKLLIDPILGVRENALKVSEKYLARNEEIIKQVISLLTDENQRVRMQAALILSTLSAPKISDLQNEILERINALRSLPMDKWNVAALTLLVSPFAEKALLEVANIEDSQNKSELLNALILNSSKTEKGLKNILRTIAESDFDDSQKTRWISRMYPDRISRDQALSMLPVFRKIEANAQGSLLAETTRLRKSMGLPLSDVYIKKSKKALAEVLKKDVKTEERVNYLSFLDHLPFRQKSHVLYELIHSSQPVKLQNSAMSQLWEANDANIGKEIVKRWKSIGPQARSAASDILLFKETHHDALLTGLEEGVINIGEMNFDLERRRTLLWWTDNENTKKRAQKLFSDSGVVNRKEALEGMKEALVMKGDGALGQVVFSDLCAQCHVYNGQGSDVGPVLTEISRKSKESLLHDILDPNAAVDTKYINHKIETNDGKLIFGMVDVESDDAITLKNTNGLMNTIQKSDIKSFESLGTSLMMEGLEGNMSNKEMADLLAFLLNQ